MATIDPAGQKWCGMADSVVHVEIEDVLESVRRLVAEDENLDSPPEKSEELCFVLTPAHRVEGQKTLATDTIDSISAPDIQPIEDNQAEQPAELGQLLNDVSRRTMDTESPNSQSIEPDHDFLDAETAAPRSVAPANFTASEYQSMAEAWKSELANGAQHARDAGIELSPQADDHPETTLEDRIAELEVAVSRSREDWEPDGSEPSRKPELFRHIREVVNNTVLDQASEPELAQADYDAEEPKPLAGKFAAVSPEDELPAAEIPQMPPMGRRTMASDVFVLSTQVAAEKIDEPQVIPGTPTVAAMGDDQPAPTEIDQLAEPASAMFSHSRPGEKSPLMLVQPIKPVDESASDPAGTDNPDDVDPSLQFGSHKPEVVPEDDVFLDVEALRTMIGELVRDELRGKMGERITHNVRQMVRQEIDRALMIKDDS